MNRPFRLALATGVIALSAWPLLSRHLARRAALVRLADASHAPESGCGVAPADPALAARAGRLGGLLASWQSIGGCGAGAASGSGVGVKWIGRNVSGGLFGVQCQADYNQIGAKPTREHHLYLNTLVTKELTDKWLMGVNAPFVYKYFEDPYDLDMDISNGGVGDASLMLTRKLGAINATALTATVGFPTGVYDARYKTRLLRQHQQVGFGRFTGSLMLDHTMDQTWGLAVLGAVAAWRGGENPAGNYRAPSSSAYAYAGWFAGPVVPALGVSVTGFAGHDRDQAENENTALFNAAANVSLEWSSQYVAVLLGASFPYQYDGIYKDSEGHAKEPWGWGPWVVALGLSFAPF